MTKRVDTATKALYSAINHARPSHIAGMHTLSTPRQLGKGTPIQLLQCTGYKFNEDKVYIQQGEYRHRLGNLVELKQNPEILRTKLREIRTNPLKEPPLEHGFKVITKPDELKRNSFTFNGRWDSFRTNLFDIQTAQRPGQPYLAIDLQPIPEGFGSAL